MIDKKQITSIKVKKSIANILGINKKYLKVKIVKNHQRGNQLFYDISINDWEIPIFWNAAEVDLIVFENVDEIIEISTKEFQSNIGVFILQKIGWKYSIIGQTEKIKVETLIKNLKLLDKLDSLTK